VAFSFTWKDVSVALTHAKCLSVIFRSGNHALDQPNIENIAISGPTLIPSDGSLSIDV
jgi:hypothetical protein